MRFASLAACTLLACTLGCGGAPTEPAPPIGAFTLLSIDGRALPILGAQSDTLGGNLTFVGGNDVSGAISAVSHPTTGQP
jgi:hypothetical protein